MIVESVCDMTSVICIPTSARLLVRYAHTSDDNNDRTEIASCAVQHPLDNALKLMLRYPSDCGKKPLLLIQSNITVSSTVSLTSVSVLVIVGRPQALVMSRTLPLAATRLRVHISARSSERSTATNILSYTTILRHILLVISLTQYILSIKTSSVPQCFLTSSAPSAYQPSTSRL